MTQLEVEITVNGQPRRLATAANRSLLDVLRQDLGLTGAKDACGGEGECGACTVLLDGEPVNACLVLIGQADGRNVVTIEGLGREGAPHPLQKAFVEAGAVQCGFCSPGAILSAKALLDRNPDPDDAAIRTALSGNLCRCTGYAKMLTAVHQAAKELHHVQ